MNKRLHLFLILFTALAVVLSVSCQDKTEDDQAAAEPETKAEIGQEELSAAVPELSALHEVVYPLWHTAYPEKDYAMIKELLPQVEELAAKVYGAALPGILRDKQADWDSGIENLKTTLQNMKTAVEADNQAGMLEQTEAFHSAYEKMVRTIRPVVAELEAFHQELYKLYHYYTPEYDLEKIRAVVPVMQEKLAALKEATLSSRLSDRQADFQAAVQGLEGACSELAEIITRDDREEIKAAVEKVHTAYQNTEKIFD
ncbi:MAG: hypothetical protein ACERK6_05470 [Candidatus Aminicenantaceae bacterium]